MQDLESVKKIISEMLLELNDNLAGIDDSLNSVLTEQSTCINTAAKEVEEQLGDFQE
ncbi:hypothetical protein [Methylocucumis oryzae]|uniref:hypothetical protein n=1 Tax=Methylocucumis oryzae TaxID=1632867 RepID=UPI0012FF3BA3|nr:hypothetical protein [Methylocucumis oryzae]